MKAALQDKKVTKTYRNGRSVFQMEYIVRLRSNIRGDKYMVTEQRTQFKDEKIIFHGKKEDAEAFYDETTSVTYQNGVPLAPVKV